MQDFILPDIGEGIVECEVVKWLVEEGQHIEEDQTVVEVMTDKAVVEIPAKHTGTVAKLYYQQGEVAKVHTPLFAMQIAGDSAAEASQSAKQIDAQDQQEKPDNQTKSQQPAAPSAKALASPAVRRLAREKGIDLTTISGSGEKGRVLKADLTAEPSENPSTSPLAETDTSMLNEVNQTEMVRTEPIRGIKAAMAKQMTHSAFSVPHFTVSEEIIMDGLIAARSELKPAFEEQNVKLSYMPFFMKALSMALSQFPIINSQVNSDCTEISYLPAHNIGLAVDSKIGLIVPNVKGVQNLSLFEIARQLNELVEFAREGRLSARHLKGGTISISNIGVLGGTVATPIINTPESAIVALGKIQRLPRFDAYDNVKGVNIMQVSWSGDHRIIDGATMVRFVNLWKSYLENPMTMLAHTK